MLFAVSGAGLLAVDILLPIPSSIVGSMLGARPGFGAGFVAAFAGMMAGQIVAYVASRWLLRRRRDVLPVAPTLTAVFLSRPVPVLAEAVVIAAGAARLSWAQFLGASSAGNGVYAAALALNGARWLPDALIGPGLLLPMLLPVVAWLIWQHLQRASRQGE